MSQGTGTVDYGRVVVRRSPRLVLSDGRELPIREATIVGSAPSAGVLLTSCAAPLSR